MEGENSLGKTVVGLADSDAPIVAVTDGVDIAHVGIHVNDSVSVGAGGPSSTAGGRKGISVGASIRGIVDSGSSDVWEAVHVGSQVGIQVDKTVNVCV